MARETIAFIGLGAMGFGMATTLVRLGFRVHGYDISESAMNRFGKLGGIPSSSPANAAKDASILVVMVTNSDQVDSVLHGESGAAKALPKGAVVIVCSTVAPAFIRKLDKQLTELQLLLVDAPVSGGVARAANGTLTVMAAGGPKVLEAAKPALSAMSENLYIIEGGIGAGSTVKMVNQLLAGVHIAASAEAMALAARAGLNTRLVYEIIQHSSGCSWMFVNRVPHMLDDDYFPHSALNIFVKDLGIVLSEGTEHVFPLPLSGTALQQFLLGSSSGYGREDDAAVVKIWDKAAGIKVASSKAEALNVPSSSDDIKKIAFVGLQGVGVAMASRLVAKKLSVHGFDALDSTLRDFEKAGGVPIEKPAAAAKDADVVIVLASTEQEVESLLFGVHGALSTLKTGSPVLISSTLAPSYMKNLEAQLTGKGFHLVDAPILGETLTIVASGANDALTKAGPILSALSEKVFVVDGGAGAASTVKTVNLLLARIHLATAAEAIALGARAGLNTQLVFDIISNAAGNSWMFSDRVPYMIHGDYAKPLQKLNDAIRDLDIVLKVAKTLCISIPLASAAQQVFLSGSAAGWGQENDAAVVKVYERLTGVNLTAPKKQQQSMDESVKLPAIAKDIVFDRLPLEWAEDPTDGILNAKREGSTPVLVVLDDDPTGTQTVHGVTVLTEWSIESLKGEFQKHPACFFILTNSRALSTDQASELMKTICSNIDAASKSCKNVQYTIVLRGDSTLRGHFPEEPDAASAVLGDQDAWIICPFFLQGGRYTINDIHYVADGEMLVPAGETEFAKDSVFGYKSSNLREWVEEKTKGRVSAKDVTSVSIATIRTGGPEAVSKQLCDLPKNSVCIVNAASERDMSVFAAGMVQAESKGKRFLCRTAAGFVSARIGIKPKPPITPADLQAENQTSWLNGGLIVVGSYVPKSTKQVEELKKSCGHFLQSITVNVKAVALSPENVREEEIAQAARAADMFLSSGHDTLIMSSRDLITGNSKSESLEIGSKVSSALVEIVKRIHTRPRYIIAKGGITSSDLATKAMGATRAEVAGQALAGVPFWKLGPGSRHPGIPYIVFPGNVGGPDALATVVLQWAKQQRKTTREILKDAEAGGYAVGAFNVYNLEGAKAVISAAEAEKSPAILQIHPAAYRHGGRALVASCTAAANSSKVPVTVHFDHGNDEAELAQVLELGFDSVMADGSHLSFEQNIEFTRTIASIAHSKSIGVEAELGRLSGTEDGLTVEEYESKLTDVNQAKEFVEKTGVDMLAVCIGNVHGKYPASGPKLDLQLLKELRNVAGDLGVFLVLHGASGLPVDMVQACIENGVRKFNVNTELRAAYMKALESPNVKDIVEVMESAHAAMEAVAAEKMRMFGSSGKSA